MFIQRGLPRSVQKTKEVLSKIYDLAADPGTKAARTLLRRDNGIKDTLLEGLLESVDRKAGKQNLTKEEQVGLYKWEFRQLPEDPFSPVFRIKGVHA